MKSVINVLGLWRFGSIGWTALFLFACAPVSTHYSLVERHLAAHDPVSADAVIEKEKERYGTNNRLLYALDRGMSLALSGKFEMSNQYLDLAAQTADDLYTESLTRHGAALLTNDNLLPYVGEDFERVMIHLIAALNYAQMNQWDEALVECRRMDTQLNRINNRYSEKKNRYREDAFARYLAGVLYEARGELNDAFLDYRKSFENYRDWEKTYKIPIPVTIGGDMMRTLNALGLQDESKTYEAVFPTATWVPHQKRRAGGEIVVVSMHGKAPYKEDTFFDLIINRNMWESIQSTLIWQAYAGSGNLPFSPLGQMVRVALPRYIAQKTKVKQAHIAISGQGSFFASSERMTDLTAIAMANLEDRLDRIRMKAIARATIKAMIVRKASKTAESDMGALGSVVFEEITEAVAAATEAADKRSWRTLPDEIHMTRIIVPPGDYQITTEFLGASGEVLDATSPQPVSIHAGEQRFLVVRTVY